MMAQISEKVQKFLVRIGNVWPKRLEDENVDAWVIEWENALKQFDAWVIEAAATRIIHDRTQAGFPFPAEVRRVCYQVIADDKSAKPQLNVTPNKGNPYKLASELIQCELGRRAAREGWVLTLRDFVVRQGRLPQGDAEIKRLIQIRDKFQQDLIDCIDGNGGMFGGPLAKLGQSMARREYEIAQRVLGSDAEDWYATRL
jgi:hypothetical protein